MASSTPFLGYTVAVLMFASSMAQTIILHQVVGYSAYRSFVTQGHIFQHFQICAKTGMRIRAGLVTAIYKKSLVLSSDERGRTTGDIVNLMSVDATRLQDFCSMALMAISGPYQVRDSPLRIKPALDLRVLCSAYPCVCFTLQPPWMVRVCWCGYHVLLHTLEYVHRSSYQKNAGATDEEPR